jgi:hypothetical protein
LENGHYLALAFLSRSYHESIKNGTAHQIFQFTVGGETHEDADLSKPMLFYSRPKGEYKPTDCNEVLLDFFLANTEISETGNKVRATIGGVVFELPKWCPYVIEGLPRGEVEFKLELIDASGNLIESPSNTVTRTVSFLEEEAGNK